MNEHSPLMPPGKTLRAARIAGTRIVCVECANEADNREHSDPGPRPEHPGRSDDRGAHKGGNNDAAEPEKQAGGVDERCCGNEWHVAMAV